MKETKEPSLLGTMTTREYSSEETRMTQDYWLAMAARVLMTAFGMFSLGMVTVLVYKGLEVYALIRR